MGLQVIRQKNKKYTVEFTGFSNKSGVQERFYCIENVDEDRLESFLDRAGIEEPQAAYALWHLRFTNKPAQFDEFGKLKGVVNQ